MFQGLGWEMYNWFINLQRVIVDSGNDIVLKLCKVEVLVFV